MKLSTSIITWSTRNLIIAVILLLGQQVIGDCSDFETQEVEEIGLRMATLGGVRESQGTSNDVEIESLARFAVDEHNKKENAILEFGRVLKAKEQTVAGTLHHFTIEALEEGKNKLYEAKVWVKPWLDFKELQEFKHAGDSPSES